MYTSVYICEYIVDEFEITIVERLKELTEYGTREKIAPMYSNHCPIKLFMENSLFSIAYM